MNNLTSRALELQRLAHELIYLGVDGEPIYSDTFCRLNKDVLLQCDSLFLLRGSTSDEEANLCLALLLGYNATIYDYGNKERNKQSVLDRAFEVLEQLPASLLKVRLLTYCYGEVYEEALLREAHEIIGSWDNTSLSSGQAEIIEELRNIEETPYPYEVIE